MAFGYRGIMDVHSHAGLRELDSRQDPPHPAVARKEAWRASADGPDARPRLSERYLSAASCITSLPSIVRIFPRAVSWVPASLREPQICLLIASIFGPIPSNVAQLG